MEPNAKAQLVAALNDATTADRRDIGAQLQPEAAGDVTSGIQSNLTTSQKSKIWVGIFVLALVVLIGALAVILLSYTVDLTTTTTGTGAKKVVTVTHPDVSAAWAVVTAVIAGMVGLLTPSPAVGGK